MEKPYNPQKIELEAQAFWAENGAYSANEDIHKEKFYCLSMLPYPSGELHMGHVRNYTIGDVIARYQHMRGKNVLQPMGWDAFGLPAENAALKHGVAPAQWTYHNIQEMCQQLQRLGYAIDWKREITTAHPSYYRWEQWLFLRLYQKGLAYRKNAWVNWDPVDNTVLANEQVIDGRGWRSGALVERREIAQWFLKITAYADELLEDLKLLPGWPEQVKTMQEHWINRSEGLKIQFTVENSSETLQVYTTRPDTLMGVSFLAIAPQHPLAQAAAELDPTLTDFLLHCQPAKMAEAEFSTMEKKGKPTGFHAIHPITGKTLPIFVANYVMMQYGSGAVMGVPAHDQRDFEFATRYQLPILPVIQAPEPWDYQQKAYTGQGPLIHSDAFNGLESSQAKEFIAEYLIEKNQAEREMHYRLRDWGISRQRYWGTPIPMAYCESCGIVPIPEDQLPVILPENVTLDGPVSPLKSLPAFYQIHCPQCHESAIRETDTFDTFMESSWYFARYTCFDQAHAMLDNRARYWLPVDQYVGGIEHAVLHLLYARFIYKVMRDEGLVVGKEPFLKLLTQGMVLKNGSKMSKSKGNTVSPKALIEQYGADTARLFIIFAAPPEQDLEWSDAGVEGAYRFLKKLWTWAHQIAPELWGCIQRGEYAQPLPLDAQQKTWRKEMHALLAQASADMERSQLNTVVSAAMKLFNVLTKIPAAEPQNPALLAEGLNILLRILFPITPHIAHSLWKDLGYGEDILDASWPKVDHKALKTDQITYVIQVNGKLRGQLTLSAQADEAAIREAVLTHAPIQNLIAGQTVKKCIVVPNKLVNVVV
ncbi:MAG: leucine--tRNA ligase [Gammaproteobacteria bacterium]